MMKIVANCCKNTKCTERETIVDYKKHFPCFLNWILGHLQSSDDENKMTIQQIFIGGIQKLSYCDRQTIVNGQKFYLTINGKNSFCHFQN